jgi:hypothetical protein
VRCIASQRARSHGGPVGAAHLRAVMACSDCQQSKFSGTIGSWIGSMAKLTFL